MTRRCARSTASPPVPSPLPRAPPCLLPPVRARAHVESCGRSFRSRGGGGRGRGRGRGPARAVPLLPVVGGRRHAQARVQRKRGRSHGRRALGCQYRRLARGHAGARGGAADQRGAPGRCRRPSRVRRLPAWSRPAAAPRLAASLCALLPLLALRAATAPPLRAAMRAPPDLPARVRAGARAQWEHAARSATVP